MMKDEWQFNVVRHSMSASPLTALDKMLNADTFMPELPPHWWCEKDEDQWVINHRKRQGVAYIYWRYGYLKLNRPSHDETSYDNWEALLQELRYIIKTYQELPEWAYEKLPWLGTWLLEKNAWWDYTPYIYKQRSLRKGQPPIVETLITSRCPDVVTLEIWCEKRCATWVVSEHEPVTQTEGFEHYDLIEWFEEKWV